MAEDTPERRLSTEEIADRLGVGIRTVQLWTRRAPTPCPHTREKRIGKGRNELWFSDTEVRAWAAAQGLDTTRMALFRPDEAEEGEKADPVWGQTYKPQQLRVSDEDLERMDAGHLLREGRREVLALIQAMRQTTAESAPQAVQQLTKAISELSREERLYEDRRHAEEVRRGELVSRGRLVSVLEAVGVYVRQSLAASSIDLAVAAVSQLGEDLEPARREAMTRALGVRIREETDKTLAGMVGQLQQAAAELAGSATGKAVGEEGGDRGPGDGDERRNAA